MITTIKTGVFAGLVLAALFACSAQAVDSGVQNDHLIVPDQRMGPVALGISDKDLFKLFIPEQTSGGPTWTIYYQGGMRIYVDNKTHKIVGLVLAAGNDADSYQTAEGLKLGSSLQDIEAALGPPDSVNANPFFQGTVVNVRYHGGALVFSFEPPGSSMADRPGDSVQEIDLYAPGGGLY